MNDASTRAHDRAAALLARLGPRPGAPTKPATGLEGRPRLVRAPGRVNLIGEYTDFNLGFVLPVAIDREVWIAYEPWDRPEVELTSVELGETRSFAFDGLAPRTTRTGSWIDYVAGTAWAMLGAGLPVRGFRGVLDSTVPVGAGLSSSAALEMASSWALAVPDSPRPGADKMAAIAQRAENGYVGVNCGIMDQFASAAGRKGHALLIDCQSNTATASPLPPALSIVVCDTGAPRRLDSSAYNERRSECEEGVRLIAEREPGVESLRDVDGPMLARNFDRLPEVVGRRCEHIVRENERVMATVAALRDSDLEALGRLFAASHASLRNLFEVSSAELDTMVEVAVAVPGVVASRMTGAGFGGCTVSLVERGAEDALRDRVLDEYPKQTGLTARVFPVAAVDGAGEIDLP
ncbi:MAG: galactokinase [Candidatus Limnocylindrales bacterium]|jgi:galactokinase